MTLRRLEFLQWFGLLAGAAVWWTGYLAGTGVSQASCNPASRTWGIPHDAVEAAIAAFAFVVVACAGAAATRVFLATRDVEEDEPGPYGRMHFFAAAAMFANLLFLLIVVLSAVGTTIEPLCHQA